MKQKNKEKRLQARIQRFEDLKKDSRHEGEYTKPGSYKKS